MSGSRSDSREIRNYYEQRPARFDVASELVALEMSSDDCASCMAVKIVLRQSDQQCQERLMLSCEGVTGLRFTQPSTTLMQMGIIDVALCDSGVYYVRDVEAGSLEFRCRTFSSQVVLEDGGLGIVDVVHKSGRIEEIGVPVLSGFHGVIGLVLRECIPYEPEVPSITLELALRPRRPTDRSHVVLHCDWVRDFTLIQPGAGPPKDLQLDISPFGGPQWEHIHYQVRDMHHGLVQWLCSSVSATATQPAKQSVEELGG
jgi:hypothetical protein